MSPLPREPPETSCLGIVCCTHVGPRRGRDDRLCERGHDEGRVRLQSTAFARMYGLVKPCAIGQMLDDEDFITPTLPPHVRC